MIRLIIYFVLIALAAAGLGWLADRPGTLVVNWQGTAVETSVFAAVVMLMVAAVVAIILWTILKQVVMGRTTVSRLMQRRRTRQGLEALSGGMIAIGAGDRAGATQFALAARRALPNEPLTHLLRAQAAQLVGDRSTARRIYENMLNAPDTELLGLRGLYIEAMREKETAAAHQFAARAMKLNPKLGWSGEGLLATQARSADWSGALETLSVMRRYDQIDRKRSDRMRAVALTASAQALEDSDTDKALQQATEAHELAPDLVPAAVVAGRIHASRGNAGKAIAILQRTWKKAPHPDLVTIYAHVKPGEAVGERLKRVRELAQLAPVHPEGAIAIAATAIEARDFEAARKTLESIAGDALTARVCLLMAKIEGAEHGDAGRVREWLSRAARAPRDPAWITDGHVAGQWAAASPVTGELDSYRWMVPDATFAAQSGAALLDGLLPPVEETVASVGEIVAVSERRRDESAVSGAMAAAMASLFVGSAERSGQAAAATAAKIVTADATVRTLRPVVAADRSAAAGAGDMATFDSAEDPLAELLAGKAARHSAVLQDAVEVTEVAAESPEFKASAWTGMTSFKKVIGGAGTSLGRSRRSEQAATDAVVVAPAAAVPAVTDVAADAVPDRREPAA